MKSVFVLGLLAIGGCEATQNLSRTPTTTVTTATTTTSQVVQTTAPTPQIPQVTTLPTPSALQTILPTAPTVETLPALPQLTQKTPLTVAPNIEKPIASSSKLAAKIRSGIGCGVVNEEYRTKVVAMAIAQTNPTAAEKLTEPQFFQAVKQSIASNQAQANYLVAQFRALNCSKSQKTSIDKTQAQAPSVKPTPNDKLILEQSGNCRDLRARGISNIDVKINPWASALDTDKDGIACKAN